MQPRASRKPRAPSSLPSADAATSSPVPAPLELGRAHAFLAAQNAFTSFLEIPCSLVTRSGSWIVVYNSGGPSVVETQSALGGRAARSEYNRQHVERVLSTQETLETELYGFSDLWVPIVSAGRCDNLLVSGPFLREPWSAEDIRHNWQRLTGERPPPQSTRFLDYARSVLRTQLLDAAQLAKFQEFLRELAELLAGHGEGQKHAQKFWHQARRDFSRLPSAQLRKGGLLVDPVSSWTWAEGLREWDAEELGVDALPTQVLALLPDQQLTAPDTLDLLVRAERFQRECVALARRLPNTMAARLEDTGALLLTHVAPGLSRTQRRLKLRELAEQMQTFVKRQLGTGTFIGIGEPAPRAPDLHRAAREAVFAVELCVHREQPLCFYGDEVAKISGGNPQGAPAARLASRLLELFGRAEPGVLELSRMDYIHAVLAEAAGRASVMRVHFEHTLFSLLALVERSAQLEAKTVTELEARLSEALSSSLTTIELITAFRQWWDSLLKMIREPYAETRRLRLERAQRFIADNCRDPLSLGRVARHAGFSRSYFSRIFKQTFGKGFEQYLTEQRLLRAERLLRSSALSIGRISDEAGFASAAHFSAAFRRSRGLSPQTYRRGQASPAAAKLKKATTDN
jgi:AraC-like DNA-binding protein